MLLKNAKKLSKLIEILSNVLFYLMYNYSLFLVQHLPGAAGGYGDGHHRLLHRRQDQQQRRLVHHVGPVNRGKQQ